MSKFYKHFRYNTKLGGKIIWDILFNISKDEVSSNLSDLSEFQETIEDSQDRPTVNLNNSSNLWDLSKIQETIEDEPSVNLDNSSYVGADAIGGKRIFDVAHLFRQILNSERHALYDCTLADMKLVREIRHGLHSTFILECKMCLCIRQITTVEKSDTINSNSAMVLGAISTGIGYSQINELAASLNMPFMTSKTFNRYHESVGGYIRESLCTCMENAAAKEAELALEEGDVDENGIPCITVVTDGAWAKRSYNVNYDSMSGVVSILDKNRSNKNIAVPMAIRKEIFSKFMRLRTAITKATAYRISENNTIDEKINLLRGDISNSPSHVFGEHAKCKELNYFKCNNLNEKNLIPAMKECGIYDDIMLALQRLLDNTSSLILNMDNNLAEHYNSVTSKAEDFLNNLKKTAEEIHCIERNTIGQSANPCWIQERAVRITASNFGKICKMFPQTSRATTVKTLLYGNFHGNTTTRYGNDSEARAIAEFEDKYKVKISQCRLFIDKKNYYLGASPDGLIGDTQLMEIKCPYSICNMNPAEAIKEKKLAFAEFVDNEFHLKRNHNYYYQIQGQLAIADKQMCYFVVWSPHGMVVEEIFRDLQFWNEKCIPKLKSFYENFVLPELIDPLYPKDLPI
ncbi:unnamed protein product [Ceutorhynchus assimilis]|uniref:YqaJ viral recombinase domain-containing protein n=1 Tax=Ceutorhynchus assimilis TaxID=467358 RepID=A0A9N9MZ59_9CUCU|nr:unnamed protein product [Ceutorhynchus assimilis]